MKKFILTMLRGPDGDISSKRVAAFVLILSGIGYVVAALILDRQDAAVAGVLIGGGTGILVAQAVSRT